MSSAVLHSTVPFLPWRQDEHKQRSTPQLPVQAFQHPKMEVLILSQPYFYLCDNPHKIVPFRMRQCLFHPNFPCFLTIHHKKYS